MPLFSGSGVSKLGSPGINEGRSADRWRHDVRERSAVARLRAGHERSNGPFRCFHFPGRNSEIELSFVELGGMLESPLANHGNRVRCPPLLDAATPQAHSRHLDMRRRLPALFDMLTRRRQDPVALVGRFQRSSNRTRSEGSPVAARSNDAAASIDLPRSTNSKPWPLRAAGSFASSASAASSARSASRMSPAARAATARSWKAPGSWGHRATARRYSTTASAACPASLSARAYVELNTGGVRMLHDERA